MRFAYLSGAVLGVLLAGCASVAERPHGESIIFSSGRGGNVDLYLAAPDGSQLRRLTHDPAPDLFPRCSRDGRFALFVRGEGEAAEIYRLDLFSGEERRLTENDARDSTPTWSPDGRLVYFTRREGRFDRIAVMPADGGEVRFLTDGTAHDTMPDISPDGRTIVHHTYRYGTDTELQLLDPRTGLSRRLTESPGSDYEAAFAYADRLVFASNRIGGHSRLYELTIADGSVRLVADTSRDSWGPRYSERSRSILFYTGEAGSWRLMRVDAGGTPVPVIDDGHSNFAGDWCPTFD